VIRTSSSASSSSDDSASEKGVVGEVVIIEAIIHSKRELQNTLYMFYLEAGSFQGGSRASTMASWHHL
jgi:hypothetical protein